jgi:phosphoribosylamine--glycine ligase
MEYKGFVFIGLMNVNGEPFVIEYNCRLGDPETEVVMPRLKNDLVELLRSVHDGSLSNANITFDERKVATIMAVSGGYPGEYVKGKKIEIGIKTDLNDSTDINVTPKQSMQSFQSEKSILVFHAGTIQKGNNVVTNGGRVLAITSYGDTIKEAADKSLNALSNIQFEGMYFRKDIGYEFI